MAEVKRYYVYDKNKQKRHIHPETSTKAIVGLNEVLDIYKNESIIPTIHEIVNTIISPEEGEDGGIIGIKAVISKNLDYYVNASTGNDENDGLTSATAFKTIMRVVNEIKFFYYISPITISINIASGTYIENITLPKLLCMFAIKLNVVGTGQNLTIIKGNLTDYSNLIVSFNSLRIAPVIYNGPVVYIDGNRELNLGDVYVTADYSQPATHGHSMFQLNNLSKFNFCNCTFVSPSQANLVSVISADNFCKITNNGGVTTVSGSVQTFIDLFMQSVFIRNDGVANFSGSMTGKRYEGRICSTFMTYAGGNNYFPGSTAGSVSNGSNYY